MNRKENLGKISHQEYYPIISPSDSVYEQEGKFKDLHQTPYKLILDDILGQHRGCIVQSTEPG
jgi:hypothetical protein